MSCCCCPPCDMMPRPHGRNTDARVPCRCVPRLLCAYLTTDSGCSDPYDVDQRASALLTYDCVLERYTGSVHCRGLDVDVLATFERDEYCQVYLVVASAAAGAIEDEYGDRRLRRLLTEYDQYCGLRQGPYQFDVVVDGEPVVLSIDRPDFVERCEFAPACGPDSEPYRCICRRAVMSFDVTELYGVRRRGLDKACLRDFFNEYGEKVCTGWEFDFLDQRNESVLFGLTARVCILDEEDEPLRFALDVRGPEDTTIYYVTPGVVEVACASEYSPDANMNASWTLLVDGQEIHLALSGDVRIGRILCCHCWVRRLCVTRFGSQVYETFVAEADPLHEERVWDIGIGRLRLDCDCDGLPVLEFTPDDPYEETKIAPVDCPLLTARGSWASLSFAYKDEQIIVAGLPCKPSCPGTAPCCGREVPRTLYVEIVPDPEAQYVCDLCDLHTVIPVHYIGQSQADPSSALWVGEVPFDCGGRRVRATIRCLGSGDCTNIVGELRISDDPISSLGNCTNIQFGVQDPGCTCDPLYVSWSWSETATACCTLNPEFPTIFGKIYLTE